MALTATATEAVRKVLLHRPKNIDPYTYEWVDLAFV